MTAWRAHAKAMLERVLSRGVVVSPEWRAAFLAVPRHVFVPRFFRDARGTLDGVVDAANPDWLWEVYVDAPLVTRRRRLSPGGYVATSSSSQPTIIAIMLNLLDAEPGMDVLEIGTGTGYNAGIMCHRLGDGHVTSIDIDAELVDEARSRLAAIGFHPDVRAGDGSSGVPERASFDRIIVTCSIDGVPPAWVEQMRMGGRLVAPLVEGGALVVLTKTAPDRLEGRVDEECAFFMPLRSSVDTDRTERHMWRQAVPEFAGIPPGVPVEALGDLDFRLWLSLNLRHVQFAYRPDAPPLPVGRADEPIDPADVRAAWEAFEAAGRPDRTRYSVTATTTGGWITLGERRWALPL